VRRETAPRRERAVIASAWLRGLARAGWCSRGRAGRCTVGPAFAGAWLCQTAVAHGRRRRCGPPLPGRRQWPALAPLGLRAVARVARVVPW